MNGSLKITARERIPSEGNPCISRPRVWLSLPIYCSMALSHKETKKATFKVALTQIHLELIRGLGYNLHII